MPTVRSDHWLHRVSGRWWKEHTPGERRALRKEFNGLMRRYPATDWIGIRYAKMASETAVRMEQALSEALVEARKRRTGVGKRPSAQHVAWRRKRAALEVGSYDVLVRRLEELTAGSKRPLRAALEERANGGDRTSRSQRERSPSQRENVNAASVNAAAGGR